MVMATRLNVLFVLGLASLLVASMANDQDVVLFGYGNGPNGPSQWGNLNPDWKICGSGKQQSPIDIVKDDLKYDSSLETLTRKYVDAEASLINNGFNVELRYDEGVGTVLVDGKNYSLQQVHWHSPSEHTLDGERFPVELHLVHKTKDGQIAVVAILYQFGHKDTFLDQLMDGLKDLSEEKCSDKEEGKISVGVVENKALKRATRKYYRYVGSLTAPPCSENVIWTVLGKVREMTPDQAAALQAPLSGEYHNNSRPEQPLNGRTVKLYEDGRKDDDKGIKDEDDDSQ